MTPEDAQTLSGCIILFEILKSYRTIVGQQLFDTKSRLSKDFPERKVYKSLLTLSQLIVKPDNGLWVLVLQQKKLVSKSYIYYYSKNSILNSAN